MLAKNQQVVVQVRLARRKLERPDARVRNDIDGPVGRVIPRQLI